MNYLFVFIFCFFLVNGLPLSVERCNSDSQLQNVPSYTSSQVELCSLCTLLTRNRYMWNWVEHPDALCTGAPDHLRQWCEYFACQLLQCPSFQAGACDGPTSGDYAHVAPCPSKYMCYKCLTKFFQNPILGCFDNFYDRL